MMLVTATPARVEALRDGQDDGRADAAADAHRVALLEQLGGLAQRPGDVADRVADFERDEVLGRSCRWPG